MSKLFLAGETHRKRVDRKTVKKHFTNSPSMDLQLSMLRCSYVSGSLTPAVSLGPRGVMTLGVQKTIQKTSAGRVNMTPLSWPIMAPFHDGRLSDLLVV